MQYQPLAIGADDFEEIIDKNYHYVDQTGFIKELLIAEEYQGMKKQLLTD